MKVRHHYIAMFILVLLGLAIVWRLLPHDKVVEVGTIKDGPYVFIENDGMQVLEVCAGQVKAFSLQKNANKQIAGCNVSVNLNAKPPSANHYHFEGVEEVVAVSDVHGQLQTFKKLLLTAGVIDNAGEWAFGRGHLVITGDIFDRGPEVTESLWFVYQLQVAAAQAGGRLHYLFGNHEVMVMKGDLRYLNPKYDQVSLLLEQSYPSLFAANSVLGRWIRQRPVAIKINKLLFAHAGLHPELVNRDASLSTINQAFRQGIHGPQVNPQMSELAEFLHGRRGPVWYRGYYNAFGASGADLDKVLAYYQASHIIVGHTTRPGIESRYDGRVIMIDAGIKYGDRGEILHWREGVFTRIFLNGEKQAL